MYLILSGGEVNSELGYFVLLVVWFNNIILGQCCLYTLHGTVHLAQVLSPKKCMKWSFILTVKNCWISEKIISQIAAILNKNAVKGKCSICMNRKYFFHIESVWEISHLFFFLFFFFKPIYCSDSELNTLKSESNHI